MSILAPLEMGGIREQEVKTASSLFKSHPKSCSLCSVPSLLFGVVVSAFSKSCIALSNNAGFSFLFCFHIKTWIFSLGLKNEMKLKETKTFCYFCNKIMKMWNTGPWQPLKQNPWQGLSRRSLVRSRRCQEPASCPGFLQSHFWWLCSPVPCSLVSSLCFLPLSSGHLENRFLQVLK